MEDERLLERERYQIEQIRQLESEELQVEEVDDEASDDDDPMLGEPTSLSEFNYDTSLAALHSYLGDVEDTHNRFSFLDGGAVIDVPLLYLKGVVLFPEATLPLRVVQPNFIAAVERALRHNNGHYIIGIIRVHRDLDDSRIKFGTTGTTAEIRQYRRLEDGSLNVVTRGQQRFRIRRRWMDVDGAPRGEIQIVQEDVPLRAPRDVKPLRRRFESREYNGNESDESFEGELSAGEKRLHQSAIVSNDDSTSSDESDSDVQLGRRRRSRVHEVSKAYWPNWVYRMYDSYCLARKASERWKQIVRKPSMDAFVSKPDLLSFHIASKIPVSESTRQELLDIDGISYRLQREIQLLERFDCVRCNTCGALVAKRSDVVAMCGEGAVGAYANPHGYVHEIMTVVKATGLTVVGYPEVEFSWFPGYGWSIAECVFCGSQMGWLFTTTNKKVKPESFWGIRCSQIAAL